MGVIFKEFLGDIDQFYKQAIQELFEMHYHSLKKNDLEFLFKCMSFRMLKEGKKYEKQCRQPNIQIKCKSSDKCTCEPKKKKHFQHSFKCAWNKSQKCFICGKKGHYAKKCPNNKAKSAKLVYQFEHIPRESLPSDTDVDSIFSEQENMDDYTVFKLHDPDTESTSEFYDSSDTDTMPESYQAFQLKPSCSNSNSSKKIFQTS
ncbi:hypothetical protein Ddye_026208 [Dipteronia dyeriana]|uniref:CCHC-type domain-containing protein n=1 Tax=Dipteronia dyeriana TaxID=168575 RepID=A0AAD9TMA7_9ROSI|nr:hypothetical protein Ddye_026208 [Dipteronia dyeriana]